MATTADFATTLSWAASKSTSYVYLSCREEYQLVGKITWKERRRYTGENKSHIISPVYHQAPPPSTSIAMFVRQLAENVAMKPRRFVTRVDESLMAPPRKSGYSIRSPYATAAAQTVDSTVCAILCGME